LVIISPYCEKNTAKLLSLSIKPYPFAAGLPLKNKVLNPFGKVDALNHNSTEISVVAWLTFVVVLIKSSLPSKDHTPWFAVSNPV